MSSRKQNWIRTRRGFLRVYTGETQRWHREERAKDPESGPGEAPSTVAHQGL